MRLAMRMKKIRYLAWPHAAKQRISDLNARVVALDARHVELEKLLKNLPAERAPIDARIASLKKSMTSKKEDMLKILKG